jgi:membrane associated rhomboid family serine protease
MNRREPRPDDAATAGTRRPDDALVTIHSTHDRRRANELSLVLASQGLHPEVMRGVDGFDVRVLAGEDHRAAVSLDTYERENRVTGRSPTPGFAPNLTAGAVLSLGWLAFFRVTGPRNPEVDWFARGSADAARILAGETWRTATALSLHADLGHALGNALAGTLFIGSVFGALGIGLGFAVVVAAGVLGNFANAIFHGAAHVSVGASTAIFGAVGVLAAHGVTRHRGLGLEGRRALAPIAAGLGLLAMLGTSERADLSAHLFGLMAGVALGVPCARWFAVRPGAVAQWGFGLGTAAGLAACWGAALR